MNRKMDQCNKAESTEEGPHTQGCLGSTSRMHVSVHNPRTVDRYSESR